MSRALAHTGGARGEGHDLVDHLRDVAARREDLQRERNLVIQSSRLLPNGRAGFMTSENIGTSSRTTCSVEDRGDLRLDTPSSGRRNRDRGC